MSFAIDLREYGTDLKKLYEGVISSDPETTWAVFGYEGSTNVLKPVANGPGDLDEFVDNFDDARILYGLVRVEFNSIHKIVLVGWVGENVSARQRLVFNAHMSSVAKQFPGHHIQMTARSSDELTPKTIMERVTAAAGSKYAGSTKAAPPTKPKYVQAQEGAPEDDWVEVDPVEERDLTVSKSEYKSSAREELERLRKGKKASIASSSRSNARDDDEDADEEEPRKSSGIVGLDSSSSHKPVGKIDLKKIREEGRGSKFADARIEKIEPSYKPVGKVDLKAIREQARKEKELKAKKQQQDEAPTPKKQEAPKQPEPEPEEEDEPVRQPAKKQAPRTFSNDDDDEEPQFASLADRMKAFQQSVSGAKPKYDTGSSRPTPSGRSSSSVRRSAEPVRSTSTAKDEKDDDDDDEEEEAPLSVAAQLARARLSKQNGDDDVPPSALKKKQDGSDDSDKPQPKANVSTFAARFAQKQEPKEEEEEEAPPAAPRRIPQPPKDDEEEESAPPAAPRRAPAAAAASAAAKSDEGLTAIAIQEYEAAEDDETGFKEGDRVINIEKVDDNWWIGENPEGRVGLFPKDYVKVDSEDESTSTPESSSSPEPARAPAPPAAAAAAAADEDEAEDASSELRVAIAQYSYEAGDDDELSFEENEKITDVDFPSDDWWSGKNSKGEFGLFPASYVSLQ